MSCDQKAESLFCTGAAAFGRHASPSSIVRSFSDVIDEYVAARESDNKIGKAAKHGTSIKHTNDSMLRQIKRVSKFWKE